MANRRAGRSGLPWLAAALVAVVVVAAAVVVVHRRHHHGHHPASASGLPAPTRPTTTPAAAPPVTGASPAESAAGARAKQALYSALAAIHGHLLWGAEAGINPRHTPLQTAAQVLNITGKYPGLVGMTYFDRTPASAAYDRSLAQTAVARDQVVEIYWPASDPVTGGRNQVADDPSLPPHLNVCRAALPGGSAHARFVQELSSVAGMLSSLRLPDGSPLPFIFRPFAEMNGWWDWWGTRHCTPALYTQLYRYTVDYLQSHGVVSALYLWAPDSMTGHVSPAAFPADASQYYPGNDVVDLVGVDAYDNGFHGGLAQDKRLVSVLQWAVTFADAHAKLPVMAEGTNYREASIPGYWTSGFLSAFMSDPLLNQIRYTMIWCDNKPSEPFLPKAGDASAPSFAQMAQNPYVLMAGARPWY